MATQEVFYKTFTADTYSCIKGRGIHKASYNLRKALKDKSNAKYCLKLDIVKFYPNVNNEILKELLRKKFKDVKLLSLFDEIIDSAKGLPLGNVTSQFLANYYLTWFDHWIKENKKVKYYFRYSDDIVILSDNKEYLHDLLKEIKLYLKTNLKLEVKGNHQVFPVSVRGIDFVGYKHFHTHTLLRKSIKKRYIKSKTKRNYNGWLVHADCKNLRKNYESNI